VKPSGIVTLCTDFGTQDAYVGIMKGVMLSVNRDLRFVDLSHDVPPQSIRIGALLLRNAVEYFPPGTVHLAVVDPGVGSDRHPIVAVTDRAFLVGPDNGLLHPAALALGLREVHRLERQELFRRPVSQTFHGRDVFAPVAAHLASGVSPRQVGTALDTLRPLAIPEPRLSGGGVEGEILHVDRFGNLITNIGMRELHAFPADAVSVTIGSVSIDRLVPSYASVPQGAPLLIISSWGLLEIAVREGNAAERFGAAAGASVSLAVRL
jgi:S-adenosylmethionine hydrolase